MIPTGVSGALHNFNINVDELNIKYIIFVLINWVYVKKDSQIIAFGVIYVLQIRAVASTGLTLHVQTQPGPY